MFIIFCFVVVRTCLLSINAFLFRKYVEYARLGERSPV